jgi:hypothetical protein
VVRPIEPALGFSLADDPLLRAAMRHPATAAAALALVILIIKVLVATNGNRETALAIVAAAGAPTVVVGLAVSIFPTLVVTVAAVLWMWDFSVRRWGLIELAAITATLVALFLSAFWLVVFMAALVVLYVLAARKRKQSPNWADHAWRTILTVLLLITSTVTGPAVWLAPEAITLGSGDTVVAYVIEDEGEWATLLREKDRTVIRPRTSDIIARRVCSRDPGGDPSLFRLLRPESATSRPADCPP